MELDGTLGRQVREARRERGLTEVALARLAGISRRHLAALEKGSNVSVFFVIKIAHALQLPELHLGGSVRARISRDPGKSVDLAQAREDLAAIERHAQSARDALFAAPASRAERVQKRKGGR